MNSVWNLGLVDAPARYAVKLGMALVWTLGPALVFVPRGMCRLGRTTAQPRLLAFLLAISVVPVLASHLLVHFGVPGYCFHYIPALLVLVALGAGRTSPAARSDRGSSVMLSIAFWRNSAPIRLIGVATILAVMFLCYPTDYAQPGLRGSFDLAFCRFTRSGLKTPMPDRSPAYWRTANSRPRAGTPVRQPAEPWVDEG